MNGIKLKTSDQTKIRKNTKEEEQKGVQRTVNGGHEFPVNMKDKTL